MSWNPVGPATEKVLVTREHEEAENTHAMNTRTRTGRVKGQRYLDTIAMLAPWLNEKRRTGKICKLIQIKQGWQIEEQIDNGNVEKDEVTDINNDDI